MVTVVALPPALHLPRTTSSWGALRLREGAGAQGRVRSAVRVHCVRAQATPASLLLPGRAALPHPPPPSSRARPALLRGDAPLPPLPRPRPRPAAAPPMGRALAAANSATFLQPPIGGGGVKQQRSAERTLSATVPWGRRCAARAAAAAGGSQRAPALGWPPRALHARSTPRRMHAARDARPPPPPSPLTHLKRGAALRISGSTMKRTWLPRRYTCSSLRGRALRVGRASGACV